MNKGVVVVYLSPLGKPLRRAHQRFLLEADARAIAKLKNYEFGGYYQNRHVGRAFFVPDQTLLLEEEEDLGIRDANDLYGGCGSRPIYKNESDLSSARRRWCTPPGRVGRNFSRSGFALWCCARLAAERMLQRGAAIRIKRPLCSGGRGQGVVTTLEELDRFINDLSRDEVAIYGIVLEENLGEAKTLSVGRVNLDGLTLTYHGTSGKTVASLEADTSDDMFSTPANCGFT